MTRKAAKVSIDELKQLFDQQCAKQGEDGFDPYNLDDFGLVGKDLAKVSFDFENCDSSNEFGEWTGLLGFRQIGNLTYIGFRAGGDWEMPIYFIIYLDQDGKTLRAYIPNNGNPWNKTTKKAFGNDEEADNKYLRSVGVEEPDELLDREALIDDVKRRIAVVTK